MQQPDPAFDIHYLRYVSAGACGLGSVVTLLCLTLVMFRMPYPGGLLFADYIVLLGVFFFGGMAALGLWIALQKPVAMRFNTTGVTGCHMPDLTWDEIDAIGLCGVGRSTGIGIKLSDRRASVRSWSWWEKRFLLNILSSYDFAFLTHSLDQPREKIFAEMTRYLERDRSERAKG